MKGGMEDEVPPPGFHLSGEVEARGPVDTTDRFKVSVSFDRWALIIVPMVLHSTVDSNQTGRSATTRNLF